MNKFKIAFLVAFTFGLGWTTFQTREAKADMGQSELYGGSEAMFQLSITATGTFVTLGPGALYRIDLASGNAGTTIDYLQAYDTWQAVGMIANISVATAAKMTPALAFFSSVTVSGQQNYKDYSPYGIRFSSGLYIYKTSADSGESLRATVYWRR